MSKKHFDALAAALRTSRWLNVREQEQWRRDVEGVADVCYQFNIKFNRARFLKACGVEG